MSKRVKAKKKAGRSLNVNLWGRANDPFIKRNYRPGEHGARPKRKTTYGIHLEAKQKLKKYYGMFEKQFRNLFKKAKISKGDTAENFVGLLERRLITVVYRANFAPTIFSARQIINHKHVLVNGKSINIGSYLVSPGDVVEIREKSKKNPLILETIQKQEKDIPSYLELDAKGMKVKFLNVPKIEDVPYPEMMDVSMVVEFYSK